MIRVSEDSITPLANEDCTSLLYETVGLTGAIEYADFSVAKTVLKTGAAVVRHFHREADEMYLFTSGTGRMTVDEDVFTVAPGDLVLVHPQERHEVTPLGEGDLEFYAITRPAFTAEDFITEERIS